MADDSLVEVYQFHVWLREISPMIWRRVLVRSDSSIADLHYTLQIVFGWSDTHLHRFVIHGKDYGLTYLGGSSFADDPTQVRLSDFHFRRNARFRYEYDFGDGWEHVLLVEKILPADPNARYPVCIKGKRACPPEDCGGVWGYADLLKALADPKHEQHQELRDWIGDDFDPEAFDLDAVNSQLQQLR